jgi:hypothetical protein
LDLESGNVVDDYATKSKALEAIREAIARDGREASERLSLMLILGDFQRLVAMQDDLVQLANAADESQFSVRKSV